MKVFIYLTRKGDLYKISHARNIDKEIKKIKPDEVIAKMEIENPDVFEARLYRRYKNVRLPGSDYFKLNAIQLEDCRRQLGDKSQLPKDIGKELSTTATSALLLFLLFFSASNLLHLGLIRAASISLAIASISFWLLLFFGNFGGYDSSDLPLFASWGNRSKALLWALLITSMSIALLYVA